MKAGPADSLTFRLAGVGDAAAVGALHAASWRTAYRGLLADDYIERRLDADRAAAWDERLRAPSPRQRVILAQQGARLTGFACVFLAEDPELGSLLDNIHVDPRARRHGLGSRLLAEAARLCRAEAPGIGLHLSVLEGNEPALKFYRAMGAQDAGTEIWDAPDGCRRLCLRLAWMGDSGIDALINASTARTAHPTAMNSHSKR